MATNGASPARKDWADLPEWVTTEEAAEISGYHPEHVRWLARRGKIGAEKKGRDWWIDRDKLREVARKQWEVFAEKSPLAKEALDANIAYMTQIGLFK